MDYADDDWKSSPLNAGFVLLMLLASPIGAPTLTFIVLVTGVDVEWVFAVLPSPFAMYFSFASFGPIFIFGYLGMLWWAASINVVGWAAWVFAGSIWRRDAGSVG